MQTLINDLIGQQDKKALASKVKPRSSASLRASILALIDEENKRVPAERQISQRTAFTVASRSLNKTVKLEKKSRMFAAYREVASFVSLAIDGKTPVGAAKHTDLLPVGHPLSTASHAMTASAYSLSVARWIAGDPRIDDSVREVVASAFAYPTDSIEHVHATERLVALTASGVVPQELILSLKSDALVAITAGTGGNSPAELSKRARGQNRDREGKFEFEGGGAQFFLKIGQAFKSAVGRVLGSSDDGLSFDMEIKGDPNIPDGIIQVPKEYVSFVKALIPSVGNPDVNVPSDVPAIDIADIKSVDVPAGWTLVSDKREGDGPDKVFESADGLRVDYYAPGRSKEELNAMFKAVQAKQLPFQGNNGEGIGPVPKLDNKGNPSNVLKPEWDIEEPFFVLSRNGKDGLKEQPVGLSQTWANTRKLAAKDEKSHEKALENLEKQKASQEEALAKSKASQDAMIAKSEDVMKANEELRKEIDANIANGLDPFGNKVPDGWEIIKDDVALNPAWSNKIGDKEYVTTLVKKEDAVSFKRTEQGITGELSLTPDGKLVGLVQDQEFGDWDEANDGFEEFVENSVNVKREAALDAIEPYDESGDIRSMIENGATPEEVLAKLDENPDWKTAKDDFDTRGMVDLPQKAQKDKWAAFGKRIDAINNMPPEFEPIKKPEAAAEPKPKAKARIVESASKNDGPAGKYVVPFEALTDPETLDEIGLSEDDAADLTPDEILGKWLDAKGVGNEVKIDSLEPGYNGGVDATLEIPEGSKEDFAKAYGYNDWASLLQDIEEVDGEEPVAKLPEEVPAAAPEAKPEAPVASTTGDWILPEGAYNLYMPEEFEPEGNLGNDSPDYTDDPKVLAKKFTTDDLTSALLQALRGKKSAVDELLAELDKIVDDEENTGKPGPKKKDKNKKVEQASGYGSLEFSEGDEYVPAEAIYNALNEQGEDAKQIAAEIYDLGTGESKNADLVSGLNKEESVGQQEPTALIDALDLEPEDVKELNAQVAEPQAAAVATAQIAELVKNGESNETLKLIANDILNVDEPDAYEQLLKENIGLALSKKEEDQAAFRALWGMMLSLDGGSTENGGSPTNLLEATRVALEEFNGTAEDEDAQDIFDRYGYFEDFIASKANIVNQTESIDDPNSLAGSFYHLMALTSKPNDTTLFRGFRLKQGSDALEAYTTENGIVSLDPRSFSTNKTSAASFADILLLGDDAPPIANHDDASVILKIDKGNGQSVDVTDISMFGDENEQLVWGDYKVTSVVEKPFPNGKGIMYDVTLSKMSERDSVLEGYSDDYAPLLLSNDDTEMPGEYYTPGVDPYTPMEEKGDGIPDEFDDSPVTIARMWDTEDLIEVFTGAIEDGSGKVLLEYPIEDGYEATVDVEAVRDALQIQGIDTNAILTDIANVEPGTEPEASTDEQLIAESNVDNPIDSIAGDIANEYDLEGWTQVGPQQGSNQGGTFKDKANNEYYVKTPKSEQHAQNEVLASALYRAAGIDAAEFYIGSADDGKKKIYSPMIPGATPDLQDKLQDPEYKKKLQEGFAIDAWLANWDVAGLVFDNVVTNENGEPVRVDPGGALLYRAQGAPKGSLFGDKVGELDSLRNASMNPQAASIFGDMTDEQQKESAAKLLDISPDDINTLVDSVITDEATATKLKDTLVARRQDILDRYGLTAEDPSITVENNKIEEPEAPTEVVPEAEAPAAPEPEAPAPADNVNNPYVTSDGVPIEPGMKLEHLKTGEIFDFVKYDKGNTSYVYVKDSEGKTKVKSTKQLKSVGNGGGETTPTEPETPSAPEAPQEPTPEVQPETPQEPEQAPEFNAANYEKTDKKVRFLQVGDLLPQYYPIKGAEENLLKKRQADPNFELPPTDEIIGTYKATNAKKRGIKVRDLETGKERYFEVNIDATIYDVRRPTQEKPTPEVTPEVTPEAPVEPAAPEAPSAPEVTEPAPAQESTSIIKGLPDQGVIDMPNGQVKFRVTTKKFAIEVFPGKKGMEKDNPRIELAGETFANKQAIKDAGFKWDPEQKTWYKYYTVATTIPQGARKEIEDKLGPISEDTSAAPSSPEPSAPEAPVENVSAPETVEAPSAPEGEMIISDNNGNQVFKGIEVTDKSGAKGIVLKVNKDNYAFVEFTDADGNKKTGWRSGKAITTTGQFTNVATGSKSKTIKPGKATGAGTPPVIVDTPSDWAKSEVEGTPSMMEAVAKVTSDDVKAGVVGASAAIDSDSIEDLDVRVMRMRDENGVDGIQLKFKLTSWAGNKMAAKLLKMTSDERDAMGVTRTLTKVPSVTTDPNDGSLQLGADDSFTGQAGLTWTIRSQDGIVIRIHRGNANATSSVKANWGSGATRAFHNLVQIQAPTDATQDQIANALALAGVADVRPATPADTRILAENRLMSVFDRQTDATKNLKDEERALSLKRIKDKYDLSADDVVMTTGASGRIETRLSEDGAKKIIAATGGTTALQHQIFRYKTNGWYNMTQDQKDVAIDDLVIKMLTTPQGGLLSTSVRRTEGVGGNGMSSEADIASGGADYVFTKPVKEAHQLIYGTNDEAPIFFFDAVKMYQRLDFYANRSDNGTGKRSNNSDVISEAKVGAYEVMFKHRVGWENLQGIAMNQAQRTRIIAKLRQMGYDEIGGMPLEQVIVAKK